MPLDLSVRPGESKAQYRERLSHANEDAKTQLRQDLVDGTIKISFDVDDYGFLLPGHEELLKLKNSFPGIKVTCFTIPLPKEFFLPENQKHFTWEKYRKWAKMVNSLDWLEVAVHGFSHTPYECDCGYYDALIQIEAVEKLFARVGLNYVKIWRAPFWQYSYDFLHALKDKGYVIALNRNAIRPVPESAKSYVYNWSYEEPLPLNPKIILGHGHFEGNNPNNIVQVLGNILREVPTEAKFIKLSEYVK